MAVMVVTISEIILSIIPFSIVLKQAAAMPSFLGHSWKMYEIPIHS